MKRAGLILLLLVAGCWETGFDWSLTGTAHDAKPAQPLRPP